MDYQNGKIYKLVNDELGLTYYGSTCSELRKRLNNHKTSAKCKKKISSSKLFESGECKIYLVEKFPCNDKEELKQRERYYIENNECVNTSIPGRTKKEYRETNKEYIAQLHKKHYEANKERKKEVRKIWRAKNKEKIAKQQKEYYEANKQKTDLYRKKWNLENKDKLKQQQKEYREDNKEKIAQYHKKRYFENKEKVLKKL